MQRPSRRNELRPYRTGERLLNRKCLASRQQTSLARVYPMALCTSATERRAEGPAIAIRTV